MDVGYYRLKKNGTYYLYPIQNYWNESQKKIVMQPISLYHSFWPELKFLLSIYQSIYSFICSLSGLDGWSQNLWRRCLLSENVKLLWPSVIITDAICKFHCTKIFFSNSWRHMNAGTNDFSLLVKVFLDSSLHGDIDLMLLKLLVKSFHNILLIVWCKIILPQMPQLRCTRFSA